MNEIIKGVYLTVELEGSLWVLMVDAVESKRPLNRWLTEASSQGQIV